MNHRQLELVQESFERIDRVPDLTTDLFHRRLFLVAPSLEPRFDPDPERRRRGLFDMLRRVVRGLDRLDRLLPRLASLARAFARRGVTGDDYEAVGTALVWTVQQVLGDAGSDAVVAAWRETYDLLAGAMLRAAADPVGHAAPRLIDGAIALRVRSELPSYSDVEARFTPLYGTRLTPIGGLG